jgi:hypothetical protein
MISDFRLLAGAWDALELTGSAVGRRPSFHGRD